MKAVRLLEKGDLNQSEIARRLKVCRQMVSRWAAEYNNGGRQGLKKAGRAGRKPELSEAGLERLIKRGSSEEFVGRFRLGQLAK